MKQRKLGKSEVPLSVVGLGCMGMSDFYGPAEDAKSIDVIHHALDIGVTFFDTADMYGTGQNEKLLGEALRTVARDDVVLSVKFGAQRGPDGAWLGFDASPAATKNALAHTLQRLGTDHVDLFLIHWPLPAVGDFVDTWHAMEEIYESGRARAIGDLMRA